MSSTLKGYIESELQGAFGDDFEGRSKYAAAIAKAVQQYLNSDVRVLPGQATVGGPTAQATVSPGLLTAP